MERSSKHRCVFLGLMALVAAFPLATGPTGTTLSQASVLGGPSLFNQATYRRDRRDYEKAMQDCTTRRAAGDDVTCPDINDPASVQNYLNGKTLAAPTPHAAATTTLTVQDLTPGQVGVLRRYQNVNTCPVELKGFLPGFYELCLSTINKHPILIRGMSNDRANAALSNAHAAPSLDDIVKAKTFHRPRSY